MAECNQLSDTLRTWEISRTLFASAVPVALGWLTSWLEKDNLLSVLPQLGIEIQGSLLAGSFASFLRITVWVVTSVFLLFLLLNQAFEGKRAIFLPTWVLERAEVDSQNIYASEDALYKSMGLHTSREFPMDTAALVFLCLFVMAVFVLRFRYYSFSVIPINLLALLVLISLVVWAIRHSSQRWN